MHTTASHPDPGKCCDEHDNKKISQISTTGLAPDMGSLIQAHQKILKYMKTIVKNWLTLSTLIFAIEKIANKKRYNYMIKRMAKTSATSLPVHMMNFCEL